MVAGVKLLVAFSRVFPQTNYAGLKMSLQKEWQFVPHVTPSVGHVFNPLEAAFRDCFLPALIGRSI